MSALHSAVVKPAGGWPVFALGFRPFYLAGAAWAALSVPLWLGALTGVIVLPVADPLAWHVHEMLFGFAAAIIAGFLFTAVRNWTGLETPRGGILAFLVLLWLAGRLLPLVIPGWPAAIVDLLFLPAIAIAIARPIMAMPLRPGGQRPWLPVAVLLGLTLANLGFHLHMQGLWPDGRVTAQAIGLGAIAMLIAAIAGRVIPSFTMAAAGVTIRVVPGRDRLALLALGVAVALDIAASLLPVPALLLVAANVVAASLHAWRLLQWRSHRSLRIPLLAILHIAYAWLPIALLLRALAAYGLTSPSLATHALAIGAMSGLMLAMMTRSALGHTGRPLRASAMETAIYVAITLAALLRLCAELHVAWHLPLLGATALAWEAAFGLFLLRYVPILLRPRIDGKPG